MTRSINMSHITFAVTPHITSKGNGWDKTHQTFLEVINLIVQMHATLYPDQKCDVQWAKQVSASPFFKIRKTSIKTVFEIQVGDGSESGIRQIYRIHYPVSDLVAELVIFPLLLRAEYLINDRATGHVQYLQDLIDHYQLPQTQDAVQQIVQERTVRPRLIAQETECQLPYSSKKVRPPKGTNPLIWLTELQDGHSIQHFLDILWRKLIKERVADISGAISESILYTLGETNTQEDAANAINWLVDRKYLEREDGGQIPYVRPIPSKANGLPGILTGEIIYLIAFLFGPEAISFSHPQCPLCPIWKNKVEVFCSAAEDSQDDSLRTTSDQWEIVYTNLVVTLTPYFRHRV